MCNTMGIVIQCLLKHNFHHIEMALQPQITIRGAIEILSLQNASSSIDYNESNIQLYQELKKTRNSHVAVTQVPTFSKFAATKLANYSKIIFESYRI